METLRGSLDTFPLEEVIRLIAASSRTGMLRLEMGSLVGRVYFRRGTLVYATTRADDGPTSELYRFRILDSRPVKERRGKGDSRPWPQPEADLIRQQIVEVFVRLLRTPKGEFAFVPGETPRGMSAFEEIGFDHDSLLEEAAQRRIEWRSIEAVLPDPSMKVRLAEELPSDQFEVTLDSSGWRFLAAVGAGGSAEEIAERLRIFEFPAAKKVAEFIGQGLLVPAIQEKNGPLPVEVSVADPTPNVEPEAPPSPAVPVPAGEQSAPPADGPAELEERY